MCGIAGYLTSAQLVEGAALAMGKAINHRGPDSSAEWECANSGVALAHRRLSIVDLSAAGHQPMLSSSGRYVVVYNGEIYNHMEVRDTIQSRHGSVLWRGHSDTETLLAAFEAFGPSETLELIDGMFAIALWDREQKSLLLARDRIGEKPLYYGWQGSYFLFGSELKALRAHPAFESTIDPSALASYCRYKYVPEPQSIYSGICKLQPGTSVVLNEDDRIRLSTPKPVSYYSVVSLNGFGVAAADRSTEPMDWKNEKAVIDQLEKTLEQSIQSQLMADVPVGAFLSGGIDSSAIVALMQNNSSLPVNTFTIGFDAEGFDESIHAQKVAKHLGTSHNELRINAADALKTIPDLPDIYDEPFADSSQIPTYLVAQLASSSVKVSLSGDGGDELFGGYNRYRYAARSWPTIKKLPLALRRVLSSIIAGTRPERLDSPALQNTLSRMGLQNIPILGAKIRKTGVALSANSLDELYKILCSDGAQPEKILIGGREDQGWIDRYPFSESRLSPMRWMMMQDLVGYLPGDILTKVDRAAMRVSLETRVPFLDPTVIKFATSLPEEYLFRDGQSKWALNQVLYRHVPKKMMDRPKAGFALPLNQWLRGPLRDWAEELLSVNALADDGLFNVNEVRSNWERHLSGKEDLDSKIWTVLMFQAWKQKTLG